MNIMTVRKVDAGLYDQIIKQCSSVVDKSGFETFRRMLARVVSAYPTTLVLKNVFSSSTALVKGSLGSSCYGIFNRRGGSLLAIELRVCWPRPKKGKAKRQKGESP
jgi:hypothetical protein